MESQNLDGQVNTGTNQFRSMTDVKQDTPGKPRSKSTEELQVNPGFKTM